jgi:hypothetical protein
MSTKPWLAVSLSAFGLVVALPFLLQGCAKDKTSNQPADKPPTTTLHAQGTQPGDPPVLPPNVGGARPTTPRSNKVPVITPAAPGGDHSYQVRLDVPATMSPGTEGVVRVFVEPKTGWKMNFDFPTRLEIVPPAGVSVVKAALSVEDAERFEAKGATFAVKFTADSPGVKQFQGKFRFAVCTDSTCDPKKSELSWSVNIQ